MITRLPGNGKRSKIFIKGTGEKMDVSASTDTKPRSWYRRHPRRTLALIVVLLILVGIVVWMVAKPDKEQKLPSNLVIASYQKQLPGLADKAKKNPRDAQALQDYAIALYATGDIQKAKEQYEAQAKVSPNDATLHNNLGNVYRDLGEYEKAVESYQKAIKLNSKNVNAYTNLANLYIYTLSKKDLGIKTYQDALKAVPDSQEVQVLLGIAYEQADDKANAKATFEKVLVANPGNAAAIAGLKRVQ